VQGYHAARNSDNSSLPISMSATARVRTEKYGADRDSERLPQPRRVAQLPLSKYEHSALVFVICDTSSAREALCVLQFARGTEPNRYSADRTKFQKLLKKAF
jgi:hypothetical protein